MASHCRRLLIITRHERRRFPERCDYITSPGFLDGPGGRRRAGLSPEFSVTVVTDLAVLENDPVACALRIAQLMPGITVEAVRAETGFPLGAVPGVGEVAPPAAEDLRVLREDLDPARVYLKEEEQVSRSNR
jgi:glutaconate CoA-transferase subunit B